MERDIKWNKEIEREREKEREGEREIERDIVDKKIRI